MSGSSGSWLRKGAAAIAILLGLSAAVPGALAQCTLSSVSPSVTICSPTADATVASPVHVVAGTTSSSAVQLVQVYVDGAKAYETKAAQVDTFVAMSAGTHRLTVQAYNGAFFKQTEYVTVTGGSRAGVTVAVSPATATIAPGASFTFSASVQNASDTSVTWSVDGVNGGSSTVGTISAAGTYTAPGATGTHTVRATSNADATQSGTASVTVASGGDNKCSPRTTSPSVTICLPAPNASVTSPVRVLATTTASPTASLIQIYVDGVKAYEAKASSVDTSINMPAGARRVTVQAYNGTFFKQTESITVTSSPTAVSVAISPTSAALAPGATQQFTATVQNASDTSVTWLADGIAGGNATTGTISATGLYTAPGASGNHTVSARSVADPTRSANASVTVGSAPPPPPPPPSFTGVLMHKNNLQRQGANLNETVLTPANVNASRFGKKWGWTVDGHVFAQPLYVPGLSINGATRNVVYVATERDTVYAFDADSSSSTPLWTRSFINPAAGITTVPTADVGSTISPEIGITGTPVIDSAAKVLYVVAVTKENGAYVQRLHALDLVSGAELLGGPKTIQATVAGTGDGTDGSGHVSFDPKIQLQRSALLLANGMVYVAWGSHGDHGPYHGWVIGYNASTLQQVFAHNVNPNGSKAGIWNSGGGLAADANGNVYYVSSNGTFTASTGGLDYGDSIVKLSPAGTVLDYFTPFDQANDIAHDIDLGVSGPMIPPDQPGAHPHLIFAAGKDTNIYVADTDNLGHFRSTDNSQLVQFLPRALASHCHETPAYWNGYVYFTAENDVMHQFALSGTLTEKARTTMVFGGGDNVGTNPSISANGTSNGIVWSIERDSAGNAVLHAFDATNVAVELYNSTQNATRDAMPTHENKWTPPTVANGKVYVATVGKIYVFGLVN